MHDSHELHMACVHARMCSPDIVQYSVVKSKTGEIISAVPLSPDSEYFTMYKDLHIPDPFKHTIPECIEGAVTNKDPFQSYLDQGLSTSEPKRKRPRPTSMVS